MLPEYPSAVENLLVIKIGKFLGLSVFDQLYKLAKEESSGLHSMLKNFLDVDYDQQITDIDEEINSVSDVIKKLEKSLVTKEKQRDKYKDKILELIKTIKPIDSTLKDIDIFIVDTFGETKKFYKFATTVFLGKSIVKGGGQNPLEPARFGAKILHGPDVNNFKDVYKYLRKLRISSVVNSPQKCANSIIFKKNMKKVQKMKYLGSTILKKTLNELDKYNHNEI